MSTNNLIIAAAGSGKTKLLIEKALKIKDGNILLTTYTQANENELRERIVKANGCIPRNIKIQTWFSFLLQHGVKPFQGCIYEKNIKGMILVFKAEAAASAAAEKAMEAEQAAADAEDKETAAADAPADGAEEKAAPKEKDSK